VTGGNRFIDFKENKQELDVIVILISLLNVSIWEEHKEFIFFSLSLSIFRLFE